MVGIVQMLLWDGDKAIKAQIPLTSICRGLVVQTAVQHIHNDWK